MSKFKLNPSASPKPVAPTSRDQFIAGASLVQSQRGSRPAKPVRLNLDLDPDLHRRLKLRAVESGISVAALVRELIMKDLA